GDVLRRFRRPGLPHRQRRPGLAGRGHLVRNEVLPRQLRRLPPRQRPGSRVPLEPGRAAELGRVAQYATAPRPSAAAWRCSSARYDERTSGPEKTEPKPSASPCSRNQRNSSGCTQRSILACFALGWRYCPIVTTSTPCSRRSRSVSTTSSFVSPRPTMIPDLVSTG